MLDSFGRPIQSTLGNDPDGPAYTITSYDSSSREHTVTNSYKNHFGFDLRSHEVILRWARKTHFSLLKNRTVNLYYGASVTRARKYLLAALCSGAKFSGTN